MNNDLDQYRAYYQATFVPAGYSGRWHLASVLLLGCGLIALIFWRYLGQMRWVDMWVVPCTIVTASLVEYCAHRGPMHHPTPGLRALFERHTRRHHRYFVSSHMRYRDWRDFHVVLFPPVLIGFFASVAIVLGALLALATRPAIGALFAATSIAYYLAYELLHLSYHTGGLGTGFGRGWLAALARHHRRHHDPRLMQRSNFNLVLPLFDWCLGTLNTSEVAPEIDAENTRGSAAEIQQDDP